MAIQALVEATAAMGVLPRPPPKSMARRPLPILRAQVPLQPLSLHHTAADGGPPMTTSPTRRIPARGRKRWTMQAWPREAPDTRLTMMGATAKQASH